MFQILLLWLAQFLVLFGLGEIFVRPFARRWWPADSWLEDTFARFWIGVALLFTFLEIWYLFRPINATCWKVVVVFGAVGCGFSAFAKQKGIDTALVRKSRRDFWSLGQAGGISLLLGLAAACRIAACPSEAMPFDSNLYHLTLVRWMNEYPAVPGLANLHCRFGNNTGFLRYAALWNTGPWEGGAAWLVPSFFEQVALTQWLLILFRAREGTAVRSFCLLSLPFFFQSVCTASASLYYDSFSLTVVLVLVVNALRGWGQGDAPGTLHAPRFFLLLCLAALAFVGKPSGALTLFLVFVVGAVVFVRAWRRSGSQGLKPVLQSLSLPTLLVAAYMALGVVLSGWPLFPLPLGKFPVDWAMPEDSMKRLYLIIKCWARLPGPLMLEAQDNFWRWFPSWEVEQFRPVIEYRIFLISLFALPVYFYCRLGTPWNRRRWLELALLGLAATNLVFWFFSAPSIRFGSAFFWCFYALLVGFWLEHLFRKARIVLGVGLLLTVYWCADFDWFPLQPCPGWAVGKAIPALTRKVTLPTGQTPPLVVRMPKGLSAKSEAVGDSPLPAVPELPPALLQWRVPGKLRSGFKIAPSPPPSPGNAPMSEKPEEPGKLKP